MRINSINCQLINDKKQIFFNFTRSQHNFFVFPDNFEFLQMLLDALKVILSNQLKSQYFEKILFNFTDDLENSWLLNIDIAVQSINVIKNGTKYMFDNNITTLLEIIWDRGVYNLKIPALQIPTFFINFSKDSIDIELESNRQKTSILKEMHNHQLNLLLQMWKDQTGFSFSARDIIEACKSLYPIYIEYKNLIQQYKAITNNQDENKYGLSYLSSLRHQIDLISLIEDQLTKIESQIDSFQSAEKSLVDLDQKIKSIKESLNIENISLCIPFEEWQKILTEYLAKEKSLSEASSVQVFKKTIEDTILPLLEKIEDQIAVKNSIKNIEISEENHVSHNWFGKFKKKSSGEDDDISKSSELLLMCEKITLYKEQILDALNNIVSDRLKNYKDSQLKWQRICSYKKINSNETFFDIVNRFSNYLELINLSFQRQMINFSLENFANDLKQLIVIIKKWQMVTGSQKAIPFDNINVLLSEAKNICRYKKEKSSSYAYLEKNLFEVLQKQAHKQILAQQAKIIQTKWQSVFEKYQWPALKVYEKNIEKLIMAGIATDNFIQAFETPTLTANPLKNKNEVYPVVLWKVQTEMSQFSADEISRLTQLLMSDSDLPSVSIFTCQNPAFLHILEQSRFGRIIPKVSDIEAKSPIKPTADSIPQKTKDLLKILNGKI